ncbi:hypothetical protein BDN70DRAFT_870878, partial [Pholiota conissans]
MHDTSVNLPPENDPQPEDVINQTCDDLDDSNIPVQDLVESMITNTIPEGYSMDSAGRLEARTEAETFNSEEAVQVDVGGDS